MDAFVYIYLRRVQLGRITIEQVPESLREQVQEVIEQETE